MCIKENYQEMMPMKDKIMFYNEVKRVKFGKIPDEK